MRISKFGQIVNRYLQIAQLGREIIMYKNHRLKYIPRHLLNKTNTLQYERILRFNDLVSKTNKDKKKYKNAIHEYWTGY